MENALARKFKVWEAFFDEIYVLCIACIYVVYMMFLQMFLGVYMETVMRHGYVDIWTRGGGFNEPRIITVWC